MISNTKAVIHGVSQESILGLLRYIVFRNDLPLHVDSSLYMYADNFTLGASGKMFEGFEVNLHPTSTLIRSRSLHGVNTTKWR